MGRRLSTERYERWQYFNTGGEQETHVIKYEFNILWTIILFNSDTLIKIVFIIIIHYLPLNSYILLCITMFECSFLVCLFCCVPV